MELSSTRLGIVGGSGAQGRGLAARFAAAGAVVTLGSREAARAASAAAEVQSLAAQLSQGTTAADSTGGLRGGAVSGRTNADTVADADLVIIAVPFSAHADTLRDLEPALRDKVVVDCVNPLGFDERGPYAVEVAEGSAAEQAQALLPQSRVVAAFHHVSAVLLLDADVTSVGTDVLVLGDDRAATDEVVALAGAVPGMRGIFAGRLRNARQVEALTANVLAINRRYKAHAGLRVTGV